MPLQGSYYHIHTHANIHIHIPHEDFLKFVSLLAFEIMGIIIFLLPDFNHISMIKHCREIGLKHIHALIKIIFPAGAIICIKIKYMNSD